MTNPYRILFVDDMIDRHRTFLSLPMAIPSMYGDTKLPTVLHMVHTFAEALEAIKENTFDLMHLDHDLSLSPLATDQEKNGTLLADCIKIHGSPVCRIHLHSMNPVGRQRMHTILEGCGNTVVSLPWNGWVDLWKGRA